MHRADDAVGKAQINLQISCLSWAHQCYFRCSNHNINNNKLFRENESGPIYSGKSLSQAIFGKKNIFFHKAYQ